LGHRICKGMKAMRLKSHADIESLLKQAYKATNCGVSVGPKPTLHNSVRLQPHGEAVMRL
jgi:hypothetical protein